MKIDPESSWVPFSMSCLILAIFAGLMWAMWHAISFAAIPPNDHQVLLIEPPVSEFTLVNGYCTDIEEAKTAMRLISEAPVSVIASFFAMPNSCFHVNVRNTPLLRVTPIEPMAYSVPLRNGDRMSLWSVKPDLPSADDVILYAWRLVKEAEA